jgi:flagellar hook assembly protein FlgD
MYHFFVESSVTSVYDSEYPQNINLRYRLHKSARITAKIYTLSGYSVYTLVESELLHGEGKFHWDGRDENSSLLPVGMYVIVVEIYDENGEFYVKKLPVALTP